MQKILLLCILLFSGCSSQDPSASYTGRLKIDQGTEYAALDSPSSIGGACEGWNMIEIRKPGMNGTGITDLLCWKREGDNITLTDSTGANRNSGPASIWVD